MEVINVVEAIITATICFVIFVMAVIFLLEMLKTYLKYYLNKIGIDERMKNEEASLEELKLSCQVIIKDLSAEVVLMKEDNDKLVSLIKARAKEIDHEFGRYEELVDLVVGITVSLSEKINIVYEAIDNDDTIHANSKEKLLSVLQTDIANVQEYECHMDEISERRKRAMEHLSETHFKKKKDRGISYEI